MPDSNQTGSHKLYAALALGLAVFGLILAKSIWGGADIAALTRTALESPVDKEQIEAAQKLSELGEVEALRTVLDQSKNSDVLSVCILGVARQRDYESMDLLLAKLDDNSVNVRSSAATALTKMLGRKYHFPASGRANQRAEIKKQIEKDWIDYKDSELFEFNKERFKDSQ